MDASERHRLLDLADKQYAAWMEMINTIPDRRPVSTVSLIDSVGSTRQPSVEEYADPVPLPSTPKAEEPPKRPTFRKSQTSKRSSATSSRAISISQWLVPNPEQKCTVLDYVEPVTGILVLLNSIAMILGLSMSQFLPFTII